MSTNSKKSPTVLVALGATGDLMAKKIIPALHHLYRKKKLPKLFQIVGFARRPLTDTQFQSYVAKVLKKHGDKPEAKFVKSFTYHRGDLTKITSYRELAKRLGFIDDEWKTCSNKLFYISVPPQLYGDIFKQLDASKLTEPCSEEEGWTRVIVEKPFGDDAKTAKELDKTLGRLFLEEQVYRVDHYLAKEMVQNILEFKFANSVFNPSLTGEYIERVDIRLHEKLNADGRGPFYESVGALRDVGQNHFLQLLALLFMDKPASFRANDLRAARAALLSRLKTPTASDVKNLSFRGQYRGYRKVKGVSSRSQVETYFRVVGFLDHKKFRNVPIVMDGGKSLGKARKEIEITFRQKMPCLCPPGQGGPNKMLISLEPHERIKIDFWTKAPGLEGKVEKNSFSFDLRDPGQRHQYVEEYEKLLLDCIRGDQTLFVSTDEVMAGWKFVDPIIEGWKRNKVPLNIYKPNSVEVVAKSDKKIEAALTKGDNLKHELGIYGLGKMGGGLARQLFDKGWKVIAANRSAEPVDEYIADGGEGVYSLEDMVFKLSKPRVVWIMVPAGKPVDEVLDKLIPLLDKGDTIIDGGNSYYENTIKRAKRVTKHGIKFLDAGVSGGPGGARNGACIMVGGKKTDYDRLKVLFEDLVVYRGEQFFPGYGAGHFVKMVHNGIEYGIMQAIAEGFNLMDKHRFKPDLARVAEVYNHGSVITSSLVEWLGDGFEQRGVKLKGASSTVAHSGEGAWTVKTAKEMKMKVQVKVIEEALNFRKRSAKNPGYTGKVLTALREQFGGHSAK